MSQATESLRGPTGATAALPEPTEAKDPYLLALVAGVLVFALYAITLAPSTAFWDTSEYITTAHILGIPHPPGNPLFVLMARAWDVLLSPTGLPVAVRVNLFSALMSAGTAFFWYLVVWRILSFFTPTEIVRRVGAGVAVLVSATAYTVWNQSNVNEKVYTISLFTIGALSWLAFVWREHVDAHRGSKGRRWHDDNAIVLMVFVLALSVGNHLMAFLAAPALVLFLVLVKPRLFLNWKVYVYAAVFGLVGLSVHMFLPLRSARGPVINEAAPTCPTVTSAMVSVVTYGNAGCQTLSDALARRQYAKPPMDERLAPFTDQMANFFQYFDWQWSRSVQGRTGYFAPGRLPFTLIFLALGVYGAVEHWRRDRKSFAYIAALVFTLSVGLVYYMNFKYGYGQVQARNMSLELAEVRERDYFYLVTFSLWGLWVGVGLTAVWLAIAESFGGRKGLAMGAPVLALGFVPLVLNWSYASRADDYAARDWAYNLLQSVEPYGVVFTNGDNDTFPLWYVQEVEGVRKDVTVMVMSYLNTDWYVRQLRDLTRPCPTPGAEAKDPTVIICQRPYVPSAATPFYGNPPKPTRGILDMKDNQIAMVAGSPAPPLEEDQVFSARGIQATLPKGTQLLPAHMFALSIIRYAWGDRPIYFATTTNAHEEMGLFPYTARQGVAYKLITPQEALQMVRMPQDNQYSRIFGAYVDPVRSQALLDHTFQYHDLLTRAHWTDDATRAIPSYYAYAQYSLAQAQGQKGQTAEADRRAKLAEKWMAVTNR
ncbi:MAG: hypothetical protein JWM27_2909 [Gemmatimonadetes bacterium]|nr:hypothetical protein [Gemmatimonadota bacterium]